MEASVVFKWIITHGFRFGRCYPILLVKKYKQYAEVRRSLESWPSKFKDCKQLKDLWFIYWLLYYHKYTACHILSVPEVIPVIVPSECLDRFFALRTIHSFELLYNVTLLVFACNVLRTTLVTTMIHFRFVANPNEEEELKLLDISKTASCRQWKLESTRNNFHLSNNPFLECFLESKNSLQPTFVANFGFLFLIDQFAFSGHDSLLTAHSPSQTTASWSSPCHCGAPGWSWSHLSWIFRSSVCLIARRDSQ